MNSPENSHEWADELRVLVVGATPPGLVLAGALSRYGADSNLLVRRSGPPPDERVFLRPPGLSVLDRLGIGDRVRSSGDPLIEVSVDDRRRELTRNGPSDGIDVLTIDRGVLRQSLATVVPESTRRTSVVAGVENLDDCVRVTFDDGDRERFDAVVGAGGPTSTIRTMTDALGTDRKQLHEWSFVLDGGGRDHVTLREYWSENGFAAVTTGSDATAVRLVVRAGSVPVPHHETALGTAARAVGGPVVDIVDELGDRSPQYRRVGVAHDGATVSRGRVALCGTAARSAGFATGLDPTLGIVDSWGLASALAGDDDPEGVLETHGASRPCRVLTTPQGETTTSAGPGDAPPDPDDPLDIVRTLRAIALGRPLDDGMEGFLPGRPDRG